MSSSSASPRGLAARELLLVALVATAHVALCPYAKVEESFNLQASHDLLQLGLQRVDEYDHVAFPGVVPRTFVGALAVSALASPLVWLAQSLLGVRKIALQLLVRWVLAMCSTAALAFFSKSIASKFGQVRLVLTCFHSRCLMVSGLTMACMCTAVRFRYVL